MYVNIYRKSISPVSGVLEFTLGKQPYFLTKIRFYLFDKNAGTKQKAHAQLFRM